MGTMTAQGCFEFADERAALAWAAAYRSKSEGAQCGDGYLVLRRSDSTMLAVVDGAGSGLEAARATAQCLHVLREAAGTCLNTLFAEVHRACEGTRGVALGVTLISPSTRRMSWAAVGDIECLMLRGATSASPQRHTVVQKGGTLGYILPTIIIQSHEIAKGDTIIMTSDGIRPTFRNETSSGSSAEALASKILRTHSRDNDDALVLVAKFDNPS